MFAPTHMAVGALVQAKVRRKLPTAIVAVASHAALDITIVWHAPYEWPTGTPAILTVIPYPHDWVSTSVVVVLLTATIAVGLLLRRYWWGMLWAMSPDIIDWGILRPLTGQSPIHHFFRKVSTPWGFLAEMLLAAAITLAVYLLMRRQRRLLKNTVSSLSNTTQESQNKGAS
ncbi:MAG: hypothetical protein NTU41_12305 [Chloroflexi bacterium]|nr:hypothetical protein [Chloroflexota bacterium]